MACYTSQGVQAGDRCLYGSEHMRLPTQIHSLAQTPSCHWHGLYHHYAFTSKHPSHSQRRCKISRIPCRYPLAMPSLVTIPSPSIALVCNDRAAAFASLSPTEMSLNMLGACKEQILSTEFWEPSKQCRNTRVAFPELHIPSRPGSQALPCFPLVKHANLHLPAGATSAPDQRQQQRTTIKAS